MIAPLPIEDLRSNDQTRVAMLLTDILIEQVREGDKKDGALLAGRLQKARELAWQRSADSDQAPGREDFKLLLDGLQPAQVTRLVEQYDRMGHLFEIAGQIARKNFFNARDKRFVAARRGPALTEKDVIPGGVDELLSVKNAFGSVDEAVKAFNTPVFEPVLTMHPTNVNTLASMQAQRKIVLAASGLQEQADGDVDALRQAIKGYMHTPLLPVDKEGRDRQLSVFEETENVVYFLTNAYRDLPQVYQEFDRGLERRFGQEYTPKDRENLHLNMHFRSWGSAGDKDGNDSIKAENTLEAIALHKKAIIDLYLEDLQKINAPALQPWVKQLKEYAQILNVVLGELEKLRQQDPAGNDIALTQDEFAMLSLAIGTVSPDAEDFKGTITRAMQEAPPENKPPLLDLLRRVRTFGFHLAKIEYRETAEQYERVVDRLIPPCEIGNDGGGRERHYRDLDSKERTALLTQLIRKGRPTQYAGMFLKAMDHLETKINKRPSRIDVRATGDADIPLAMSIHHDADKDFTGYLRTYKKGDTQEAQDPITYHTLMRMVLAREHPDMIEDNVLAECKGAHNMLEALFLQHSTWKYGNRAALGIVPLFEEPATMKEAKDILKAVCSNDVYKNHLEALSHSHDRPTLVQQVQIAHSDNARRSGVAAARGFIHAAHPLLREGAEEINATGMYGNKKLELQFFEGGSQSDAYRNGVRAITSMVNAFGLHRFSKMTFQGGDLLNYFNHPDSIARLMSRHFVHCAEAIRQKPQTEERPKEKRINPTERALPVNPWLERKITQVLQDTLQEYESQDFNIELNAIGALFADPRINYKREAKLGNISSRAASRTNEQKTEIAADPTAHFSRPVNTHDMRTISFSEVFAHAADIVPSWIGAEKISSRFNQALTEWFEETRGKSESDPERKAAGEVFTKPYVENNQLTPEGLHYLYRKSPAFRDVIDKCSYGLLMSNVQSLADRVLPNAGTVDDGAQAYIHRLAQIYQQVAALVHMALHGEKFVLKASSDWQPSHRCRRIRTAFIQDLPRLQHLKPLMPKLNYVEFLSAVRDTEQYKEDDHLGRLVHNGKDTVYHGRTLVADDIRYGKALDNGNGHAGPQVAAAK